MVALKNLLNGCMRGMAVLVLILGRDVDWKYGLPMAIGGLIGGYIGGMLSHRVNPSLVRWIVITIGLLSPRTLLDSVRPRDESVKRRVDER